MEIAATEMSGMLRKSLETRNWVAMKEPRRVSKLWEQILEDMDILDGEVTQLYNHEILDVDASQSGKINLTAVFDLMAMQVKADYTAKQIGACRPYRALRH